MATDPIFFWSALGLLIWQSFHRLKTWKKAIYWKKVYKYNGSSPYKLKKNINKRIKAIIQNIHDEYTGSLNTGRKGHEIVALDGG